MSGKSQGILDAEMHLNPVLTNFDVNFSGKEIEGRLSVKVSDINQRLFESKHFYFILFLYVQYSPANKKPLCKELSDSILGDNGWNSSLIF